MHNHIKTLHSKEGINQVRQYMEKVFKAKKIQMEKSRHMLMFPRMKERQSLENLKVTLLLHNLEENNVKAVSMISRTFLYVAKLSFRLTEYLLSSH